MVAFAASCLGLLLFLWISFGGSTSLSPRGYEISAEFNQATELGSQADVRISGVDVGHVVSVKLGKEGLTDATIEIESRGQRLTVRAGAAEFGRLESVFTFAENVEPESASARWSDGVLTVIVPKHKARKIALKAD